MIKEKYYQWLVSLVSDDYHSKYYTKLLEKLYSTEFTWTMAMDKNRATDGIDLRVRFADENELLLEENLYPLDGPCTVLEMMVALSLRCEETIMGDADFGDRTGDWFWGMVRNLGLQQMDNYNYDELKVNIAVQRLLNRAYQKNGEGGLFTVRDYRDWTDDLRNVDIWYQMLWYLDEI